MKRKHSRAPSRDRKTHGLEMQRVSSRIQHPLGPVYSPSARVLILGSMPGVASLRAEQYYAHPRNQFWDIMGRLIGAGRDIVYPDRLTRLIDHGIALWDVIASCERAGSLDASIVAGSVDVHSIPELMYTCPDIRAIYFNGKAAEAYFNRHVRRHLPPRCTNLSMTALPSTSPAHAALSLDEKFAQWNVIKTNLIWSQNNLPDSGPYS